MSSIDLISESVKVAWNGGAYTALMPNSHLYYDRAQQANETSGFPYGEMFIREVKHESMTVVDDNSLVTYELKIAVYTMQGQTGGSSGGKQVIDQGNLMRAFDAILNVIPPNNPWNYVTGFLHCLKVPPSEIGKDEDLYLGKDVIKSIQTWSILVVE